MIPFIEKKKIDWYEIKKILQQSEKLNQYANDGPAVKKLENFISQNVLKKNIKVSLVSSGTSALYMASNYFNLELKNPIRWVVSANGFFSTSIGPFHKSKIIDCNQNGLIDLKILKKLPKKSYDGIVFTNLFGYFSNFKEIINFCEKNNKYLLFDNAASLGTLVNYYDTLKKSKLNWAEAISFHHTKPWGMGEGGCLIYNNNCIDEKKIVSLANFGRSMPKKHKNLYNNYKISDFSAAIILQRLKKIKFWKKEYIKQCNRIIKLAKISKLKTIVEKNNELSVPGHLPIFFNGIMQFENLKNKYVVLQKYYQPLDYNCKNAAKFYNQMVSIPCHSGMKKLSDKKILKLFKKLKETCL